MLSVYNGIRDRARILWLNIVVSYQLDTAYVFEAWGNMISTLIFTLTYIAFISIIFANVTTLAGYSRNEMLLLAFMAQVSFYLLSSWSIENAKDLITDINQGNLDLVLIRPVPALFFVTFKRIYLLGLLRDAVIPLAVLAYLIHWNEFSFSPGLILAAIVIALAGQWCVHVLHFLFAMPVFWLGESENIFTIIYSLSSMDVVPYEGLTQFFKWVLLVMLPVFVPTALATSVLLGKASPLPSCLFALGIAGIFSMIKLGVWKAGLRSYTSASS